MASHGAEYDRRDTVLQTLRAERSPSEINKFLRVPRSTGYQISKCMREQQSRDDPQDKK